MSEKIKIGFLGYGTRALDALMEHEGFRVEYFIAPLSRLCADVYDARHRYPDIPFYIAKNNDDLVRIFDKCDKADVFLMNACPIILRDYVIEKKQIYNIHPGNLHNNRGHQPHQWTVLLGEKESEIVCHTVTPGIDEGEIVGRVKKDIPEDLDALEVLDLLEDQVPLLLDALYSHIVEGTPCIETITGGEYRPVLTFDDYEIKPEKISDPGFKEDMLRKIRARVMNHGAFFYHGQEMVYVDRLLYDEPGPNQLSVAFHGSCVFIEGAGKRYVLNLRRRIPKSVDLNAHHYL